MKTHLPIELMSNTIDTSADNKLTFDDVRALGKVITVSVIAVAAVLTVLIQPFL